MTTSQEECVKVNGNSSLLHDSIPNIPPMNPHGHRARMSVDGVLSLKDEVLLHKFKFIAANQCCDRNEKFQI
jgi:hypothetical protein